MLEIQRDVIEVEMLNPVEPDPDWVFVDKAGHEHRWEVATGQILVAPTIEYLETDRWWCLDCREEHLETEPHCRECGDPIKLGYRSAPSPQYITGATRYLLDGREITKEEADAILTKAGKNAP